MTTLQGDMFLPYEKAAAWMRVAKAISTMGTCPRRNVGALILDDNGHIMSTGYNGMPRGMKACVNSSCDGLGEPSGQALDRCLAVHAEQNALMQCRDTREARVLIVTASPCMHCMKMLLNTSITDIVYAERYMLEPILLWESVDGRYYGHVEV
jgi:dCMP deaminase